MTFLRQWTLRFASVALTGLYTLYRAHPAVWRLMARNYRPWMGRFARLHAWMTCQFAWLEVPAYREHLHRPPDLPAPRGHPTDRVIGVRSTPAITSGG